MSFASCFNEFCINNSCIFFSFLPSFTVLEKYVKSAELLYGRLIRVWVLIFPFFAVIHPEDLQTVLSSRKHTEKIFFYKLLHNFLGNGLITSSGEKLKLFVYYYYYFCEEKKKWSVSSIDQERYKHVFIDNKLTQIILFGKEEKGKRTGRITTQNI